MSVSLHVGASQLTFFFLALFLPLPQTVTPHPLSPSADPPDLEAVLLNLQSALEDPEDGTWEEPRAQRGLLVNPPLSAFLERNYQEGGEGGDEGLIRSDILTNMAGGLQAVDREKGGFVFRFGKKRWTNESQGRKGAEPDGQEERQSQV
uniref:Uncharacterized protein n=1 Tax=Gouania willdenowi TaxID=441366 RepID=A0A8C5HSP9_GOUWI